MKDTVVVIGPGQIGQAVARRVGVGKHLVLADQRESNAKAAAETLSNAGYDLSPAKRAGTPDEVASVAALLMGPDGGFISGSDFLMDGGVTASYWYGPLSPI
jgi:NAD(P)-dependent dehydrogenase (short-subunit alcohol dehydrogenase family)